MEGLYKALFSGKRDAPVNSAAPAPAPSSAPAQGAGSLLDAIVNATFPSSVSPSKPAKAPAEPEKSGTGVRADKNAQLLDSLKKAGLGAR